MTDKEKAKAGARGKTSLGGKTEKISSGAEVKDATIKMKPKHGLGEGKALTVAQRLQRGRQIKRIKPKLKRGAKRALSQSPSASRIWKRSERAARNLLKKRFSPVKGVSYSKLSTTQKIFVDRALEKRQKLIKKVAKRLLPKVRAASFKRLQSYRAGTGRSRLRENEAFEAQFNQRPLPQIIESMIIDMGDHPMADSLMTLLDLTAAKDSPAVRSLKEKAESINVPFVEVLQVYADALLEYKRSGSKLTGEQYAFNAVNVYVADRKAPTINENFEELSEGLFGAMFIPPTTRLMHAISSSPRYPSLPSGGHKDHYSNKDPKDEAVRSTAMHSYAKAKHAKNVEAAGSDPTRHKYNPNQSISSRAKHSSSPARNSAISADTHHREVIKNYPKEYAVSPRSAITAHLQKSGASQSMISNVHEYDKHYRAAKGLGESVIESVSIRSHGDEKGGAHLLWKGKKRADLKLVSKGLTSGGHRYTLHKANGEPVKNVRGGIVSMTAKGWQKFLHPHFEKQDKLAAMKSEARIPADDIIDHATTAVSMMRRKGVPLKTQAADVSGTIKAYSKIKAKTLIDALKKRRALNKEPE
jgi:hypothetical protein